MNSERDLSSLDLPFVAGSIETDGTERAICKFDSEDGQILVGKLVGSTCYTAIDVVDEEETRSWSSLLERPIL